MTSGNDRRRRRWRLSAAGLRPSPPGRSSTVAGWLVLMVVATGSVVSAAEPVRGGPLGVVSAAGTEPAGGAGAGADALGAAYRWPLPGPPPVARPFEPPAQRWLPGHRGVDLAAEAGAQVRAAGSGVVFFAGPVGGRPVVSIAHPDGLRTTYEPVAATVAAGDPVRAGDPIGVLAAGHPGCPGVTCLHWGVRRGEVYLDPLSLFGIGRVRLLPGPEFGPVT